jgi:hypothetical protein
MYNPFLRKAQTFGPPVSQHAEISGDTRADDTGVSGMPADRPVATPAEGLGNEPDANAPEPKGASLSTWYRLAP